MTTPRDTSDPAGDHAADPAVAACPFCAFRYAGNPTTCPRCGTLLGEAVVEIKRFARAERRLMGTRKALSDTFFLVGLLLGGPMISFGGQVQIGAFIVLAGAIASVLRRYTDWSTPGTVVVGSLLAVVAASWFAEPRAAKVEEAIEAADTRRVYADALSAQDPNVAVEARGPGMVTVWYTLSGEATGTCGDFPPAETRSHLASLGFLRIVVNERNSSGGPCSFAP